MTLKERKEAIKTYMKENRDFMFFCGGATAMFLAQMTMVRHTYKGALTVEKANILVMDEHENIITV
jgi:hypothetical protein